MTRDENQRYEQRHGKPRPLVDRKVAYGAAVGGPLSILAAFGLSFLGGGGVPVEVVAATGSILTSFVSWFTHN